MPFTSRLDVVKKGGKDNSRSPGIHSSDVLPDGLNGDCPGGGGLVGEGLQESSIDAGLDEDRLQCLDGTGLDESANSISGTFTSSGRLLIGKSLDDGLREPRRDKGRGTVFLSSSSQDGGSCGASVGIGDEESGDINGAVRNGGGLERSGSGNSNGGSGSGRHFYDLENFTSVRQ